MTLLLAIRVARREVFRFDTQDLLVLLLILVIPLVNIEGVTELQLGRLALRCAVLLYCCEFLFGVKQNCRLLQLASIASMGFLAVVA